MPEPWHRLHRIGGSAWRIRKNSSHMYRNWKLDLNPSGAHGAGARFDAGTLAAPQRQRPSSKAQFTVLPQTARTASTSLSVEGVMNSSSS